MKQLKIAAVIALIVALCSLSLIGKQQDDHKPKKKLGVDYQLGFFSEADLRRHCRITAMPEYPSEAVSAGAQGLAQVAVLFDENGDYHSMKVLESPHPAISKAVEDALKQWKMKVGYDSPYPETRLPIRELGQVQFHFIIREGVASVEPASPEEQRTTSPKFNRIASGKSIRRMQN